MSNHSVHKASDLPQDERLLVERWLGRVLSDEETISLNVYRPHPAPAGDEREALRREIVAEAREIGSRAQNITDDEVDALLNEAAPRMRTREEIRAWLDELPSLSDKIPPRPGETFSREMIYQDHDWCRPRLIGSIPISCSESRGAMTRTTPSWIRPLQGWPKQAPLCTTHIRTLPSSGTWLPGRRTGTGSD